jgi:Fe-S-cluster containining protein
MKIQFPFAQILAEIRHKPVDMITYAQRQMELVREKLQSLPAYNCAPSCNDCCHGSILMSYVEYVNIIAHLGVWDEKRLQELFASRLGILEDENKLLCPFVSDELPNQHCAIYSERPLICRVFGTSAAPCQEEIKHPHFPDRLFYQAYDLLYYKDGGFIGLPLGEGLALYEAPFDVWAIADSGRVNELMDILAKHGSMRAVLCDTLQNRFFVLADGERRYLD